MTSYTWSPVLKFNNEALCSRATVAHVGGHLEEKKVSYDINTECSEMKFMNAYFNIGRMNLISTLVLLLKSLNNHLLNPLTSVVALVVPLNVTQMLKVRVQVAAVLPPCHLAHHC